MRLIFSMIKNIIAVIAIVIIVYIALKYEIGRAHV